MPYPTINILKLNQEIHNYINNVKYGIFISQFNHLSNLIQSLIVVHGDKPISLISKIFDIQLIKAIFISF